MRRTAPSASLVVLVTAFVLLPAFAVLPAIAGNGSRVGAVSHSGVGPDVATPGRPDLPPGTYAPPVDRPVRDPFRLDAGQYGRGNRGLEYATVRGDTVRAVAAGRVAFVGPVAGRLVISIDHPDGRRSTLTRLLRTSVTVGDLVARGTPVGTADQGLHLGLLEGRRYVDPSAFFGGGLRRAVLVPVEPPPGGPRSSEP